MLGQAVCLTQHLFNVRIFAHAQDIRASKNGNLQENRQVPKNLPV